MTNKTVESVARALKEAHENPNPYISFNFRGYGTTDRPYIIRNNQPDSEDYDKCVFSTGHHGTCQDEYDRLTEEFYALAAIKAHTAALMEPSNAVVEAGLASVSSPHARRQLTQHSLRRAFQAMLSASGENR